jgi:hypothetical protein
MDFRVATNKPNRPWIGLSGIPASALVHEPGFSEGRAPGPHHMRAARTRQAVDHLVMTDRNCHQLIEISCS